MGKTSRKGVGMEIVNRFLGTLGANDEAVWQKGKFFVIVLWLFEYNVDYCRNGRYNDTAHLVKGGMVSHQTKVFK